MDAIFPRNFLDMFFSSKKCGGGGKRSGKNRVTAYQGFLAHNCNNK